MWNAAIGTVIVWVVGVPLSYIFGHKNIRRSLDPNLVSPIVRFLLPKGAEHLAMQEVATTEGCDGGKDSCLVGTKLTESKKYIVK